MAPDQAPTVMSSIKRCSEISLSIQKDSETIIVDFMKSPESRLDGSLHPALKTNDPRITFDKESHTWKEVEPADAFSLEALCEDFTLEQESFRKAMEEYQETQKPKHRIPLPPSSVSAQEFIDDILESISQARQTYEDDAIKGSWGAIRKAFRKLGANESALVAWLGLLPVESNYISVLCGGLKLIVGAAARLRKLDEEVVDALCQIPQSIRKCRRLLSINKGKSSLQLRDHSVALYVAILHAMGHILNFFTQNQLKKISAVFVSQARFEAKLTARIQAIKECSKAIDDEALICSQELGKNTNEIVKTVEEVVKIENEKLDQLHATSRVIIAGNTGIQQSQEQTNAKIETLAGTTVEALTCIQKVFMDVTVLKAFGVNELQKQQSVGTGAPTEIVGSTNAEEDPSINSTSNTQYKTGAVSFHATKRMLLSRLREEYTTKEFSQTDIRSNLSHVLDLSLEDQDRAVYAMQALSQHSFFRQSASSVILINGQAPDVSTHRTPLSFLCAKFCHALGTAPKTILCLSFFCGEHASQDDKTLPGPAAILNSLIAQLVSQYKYFDFKQLKDKYVTSLDCDDVTLMMKVLSKLVSQLPDNVVVFCVLDELTEYALEDETENLLGALVGIVRRRQKKREGCMFKLLLTTTVELCLDSIEDLDEDEVINVPEGLERQGGFTALQWDLSVGQDVEDLRLMSRASPRSSK